ncbi:hypothetical protein K4L06_16280 [Lysobacter sp. BMK333-48F3]|uniref:hypothetical protein n=1 Tax=Lysobacter sp. BMK333-48F3 TaxID=2867962 RepID=UPI001C8B58C5|nr:hypothetical protein [Lysobacter sp. BMK333-48F3]MBX9402868.1 hypothetical protein [Lysobacter sp. BMK333-48F3]
MLSVAGILLVIARPDTHLITNEIDRRAAPPKPVVATADEYLGIVRAVVAASEFRGLPPPPPEPGSELREEPKREVLLLDRSVALCQKIESKTHCSLPLRLSSASFEVRDYVPLKWLQELELANAAVAIVPNPRSAGIRYVPSGEVAALASDWEGFYADYPRTTGILRMSVPVFLDTTRSRALIYVEHRCGGFCGAGTLHLLHLEPEGWKQVGRLWMSMS